TRRKAATQSHGANVVRRYARRAASDRHVSTVGGQFASWIHETGVALDFSRPRPCHQLRTEEPSMRKAIALLVVVAAAVAAACMQVPTEYRFVVCVQSGDTLGKPGVPCAVVDTVHP